VENPPGETPLSHRDLRSRYRSYLLAVLATIVAFENGERWAVGILVQSIKTDLHLSDTQLGLLTGMAYAFFNASLGVWIARWADRGNRAIIIAVTTALWSAATALCGVAGNFLQLLLMRVAVAVGEAGCVPVAPSLIADYFGRAERPRAMSRYLVGSLLGPAIWFFLAGRLNEYYGWRRAFVCLGLPGVAVALLAGLTLKEPRRAALHVSRGPLVPSVPPSMKKVGVMLWGNQTFRHLLLFFSISAFFNYGIVQWIPPYFARSFGLQTGQVGTWLAIIFGAGGVVGTYLGGELVSRFLTCNEQLQLRAIGIWIACYGLMSVCIYLTHSYQIAFVLLAIGSVGNAAIYGPLFATLQTLVPPHLRAQSLAVLAFFFNLIGAGLGPLMVGLLSDFLHPWAGEESLRYALVALSPGYCWSSWYLWRACRSVTRDIEAICNEYEVDADAEIDCLGVADDRVSAKSCR